ncbi:MAG: hypothetical protein OQK82_05740 [Candidatus Pacearchaeota archaeon]|nr:hypothetical protein [Candidatus Pacearchaeota archaeon]
MTKIIIFDASILITFAMNGLLPEFKELRKIFPGKFIITNAVKQEAINTPLKIKRFELEALKIQNLLDEKILELPESININQKEVSLLTQDLLNEANSLFQNHNKDIHLIDIGEASCLALSKILDKQETENIMAIDERTMRMLCEKPENLKALLQKKLHTKINYKKLDNKSFTNCRIIRSAELIYIAYKKGLVRLKGNRVLDALLYAVQFKGCSISHEEIEEIKKLG